MQDRKNEHVTLATCDLWTKYDTRQSLQVKPNLLNYFLFLMPPIMAY